METAGTQHLIERAYRESGQFQWVREMQVNAKEAGATRIEFGIEWQAVESKGIYRRTIADNGCGMSAEQLVEFFNTFGGGGKPIGGAHENFGVGSKTSLLPWNKYGMVVISWVGGDASMIWVTCDPETGEYGLKLEECDLPNGECIWESVYDPYDDEEHGCDWASVKPDWIEDHGTVVILLGNGPSVHTVQGDPTRDEADIKGISSYLNRRMWEIPPNVAVHVDELRNADRANWPPDEETAHGPPAESGDQRTNNRKIEGARYYIEYSNSRFKDGKLGAHGEIFLKDGTQVDWYLWDGSRPKVHSYAAIGGYIATLYAGELYDVTFHNSTYRSFGISESSVRSRVWLILRPPVDPEGKRGVYPRTDRSSLLIKGGPGAGLPLPISDWAAEFADNMPDELVRAIKAARQGSSGAITDTEWREKLAEKFGSRWRVQRLRVKPGGGMLFTEASTGIPLLPPVRKIRKGKKKPEKSDSGDGRDGRAPRIHRHAKLGGTQEGEWTRAPGGLPKYRPVGAGDVSPGMLAAWQPNDVECPEGVVLLNVEHPVLCQVIEHWQAQYADHHAESIRLDVIDVYGQVAVSKVAHSEHLKSILASHIVEKNLRSEEALTMALLGLMSEDQMIATRIGGKYSKKRYATAESRRAQS
jgi:hypothetical protein